MEHKLSLCNVDAALGFGRCSLKGKGLVAHVFGLVQFPLEGGLALQLCLLVCGRVLHGMHRVSGTALSQSQSSVA